MRTMDKIGFSFHQQNTMMNLSLSVRRHDLISLGIPAEMEIIDNQSKKAKPGDNQLGAVNEDSNYNKSFESAPLI
jgi:hypothetical protein